MKKNCSEKDFDDRNEDEHNNQVEKNLLEVFPVVVVVVVGDDREDKKTKEEGDDDTMDSSLERIEMELKNKVKENSLSII